VAPTATARISNEGIIMMAVSVGLDGIGSMEAAGKDSINIQ
jgi:hypothetical protein